jgi:hypothetical protein
LDGIKEITSGWQGPMEINTVIYDKTVITIDEMEKALKKAGTYRETIRNE